MKRMQLLLALMMVSCHVIAQENEKLNKYTVGKDIVWASPEGFELTMDIYTPQSSGRKSYPVLVIFHGGGWLINNKSIMDQMSQYVVEHGDYVVCNVNYRLLVDQNNTVTMDQIVGDVFGSILWIKENIKKYNGDPDRVAVTGDSAGGHLASMVVVSGNRLSATGFDEKPLGFKPTYLPKGMSVKAVLNKGMMKVQAAAINYGAFDIYSSALGGFEKPSNMFWQMGGAKARPIFGQGITVEDDPEYYKAVSPVYNISLASEHRLPPQFFNVGSKDNLTTPDLVKAYVDKLRAAGHSAEYWVHEGRPHAYLDAGSNDFLGTIFEKDAPEALNRIIDFLNSVFY